MTDRHEVAIRAGAVTLPGELRLPERAVGVVAFAHGSGSGRHSPRNRAVAAALNDVRLATLLLDLLTEDEERVDARTAELRFDIGLLAERMVATVDHLRSDDRSRELPVGLFGASTGAAAALVAAARRPGDVGAVVSRGGRPDLAAEALGEVRAPTLLIVGGDDHQVLELNRAAQARMSAETALEVVPGAGHLFEEPGALDRVADAARAWFLERLGAAAQTDAFTP